MFYNNYKWNITFNNCYSLYCIPVTYIIEYTTAFQLKKKNPNMALPLDWFLNEI